MYWFTCRWRAPFEGVQTLSKLYPRLTFRLHVYDAVEGPWLIYKYIKGKECPEKKMFRNSWRWRQIDTIKRRSRHAGFFPRGHGWIWTIR